MSSRFVHTVACDIRFPSFLMPNNTRLCGQTTLYPSADGHVSCFHLLAAVTNAAMNTCAQITVQASTFDYSGYDPEDEFCLSLLRHSPTSYLHCHLRTCREAGTKQERSSVSSQRYWQRGTGAWRWVGPVRLLTFFRRCWQKLTL